MAGDSTLCRLEQRVDRAAAVAFHEVLVEEFIASFATAPTELILDFDATDDRVHGQQEGRHFHGYYGHWCFLPLYVFCGEQLLVAYLRPSIIDASRHAWAILKLLTARLRQAWPEVKLTLRADSGFCRRRMLHWTEDITRHTFGSNHLALHGDIGVTATQMGNSPEIVRQRYLALVKPVPAAEFWNITPRASTRPFKVSLPRLAP